MATHILQIASTLLCVGRRRINEPFLLCISFLIALFVVDFSLVGFFPFCLSKANLHYAVSFISMRFYAQRFHFTIDRNKKCEIPRTNENIKIICGGNSGFPLKGSGFCAFPVMFVLYARNLALQCCIVVVTVGNCIFLSGEESEYTRLTVNNDTAPQITIYMFSQLTMLVRPLAFANSLLARGRENRENN